MTKRALGLVFRPTALEQMVQSQRWYDSQRVGLGAEFARSIEAAVARILRQPLSSPVVHADVRRNFLKRFPYALFYLIEPARLVVLSCLHTRRDPSSWPAGGS